MKKILQISLVTSALLANEIALQKVETVGYIDKNSTSYTSSLKLTIDKLDKMV